MEKIKELKKIRIYTMLVFLVTFLLVNVGTHMQVKQHIEQEQYKASYTAEATVRRIESQMNRYLAREDILKKMIESGTEITENEFRKLGQYMMDDDGVIQAIEVAKSGTITMVYPLDGNEEAIGLNLFQNQERKTCAELAKASGEYSIGGPYSLVQGGTGALLMDPIYVNNTERQELWGLTLLVIDWDKFIGELELDKLEDASYHYQIWKTDPDTGEKIVLAQSNSPVLNDAMDVLCDVPNDTWHFEILPENGWYSGAQLLVDSLISALLALLLAVIYWQFEMRRYRENIYTEKIKKAATEARAANAAKTNFLSRMSHDIRTPLNGIIGLLKIDEQHPEDDTLIQENRKKMMVAADHLLSLINDVLQMSKLEAGELVLRHEIVNLNELTEDILTIVSQRAADAGVTLKYDPASDQRSFQYVYGSALHIRQLFLNIYGNCIKYNHVGGYVNVKFQNLGEEAGVVTYRWIISDNGIGMSEEFLTHIFEPFAQEHEDERSISQGTGLGMAIVKGLIDKMGGTIEITSKQGMGSAFTITLPFEIVEKEAVKNITNVKKKESIQGLRLLLVEDNDLNAEIADTLLSDEGAKITRVTDGRQALDLFAGNPSGTFDAILMDIMMPNMDGITATKKIRELDRPDASTIPIIAMTANAFAEDAQKCREAGMNDHLSKPLQMEKVIATIAKYCNEENSF